MLGSSGLHQCHAVALARRDHLEVAWTGADPDPRALQDVVAEIRREAGAQFDPALAAAFVEYLLSRSRG